MVRRATDAYQGRRHCGDGTFAPLPRIDVHLSVMTAGHADRVAALARRWAAQLGQWAIPEAILRQAPESPWGFPAEIFTAAAQAALTEPASPSRQRALEALGAAGTVLDVGSGAGAASLPLAPPATSIVAVDESETMLDAFPALAGKRSVAHSVVRGRWPEVAADVDRADVVVCHHVVYNVADLVPFLEELDRHARRRVVVELTEVHPQADLTPLWRELHGIERPQRPHAGDMIELLTAMGIPVQVERFHRLSPWATVDRAARVAFARKRLCLDADRDPDVDRLLGAPDRRLVTLWWDRAR